MPIFNLQSKIFNVMSVTTEPTTKDRLRHASTTAAARDGEPLPVLAIVVPCLDEELVVEGTAQRLSDLLDRLSNGSQIDTASFLYFVDDGSRDATWSLIEKLHARNDRVKGLKLAR